MRNGNEANGLGNESAGDAALVGIRAASEGGFVRGPGAGIGDETVCIRHEKAARGDRPGSGRRGGEKRTERQGAEIERDIGEDAVPDGFPVHEAALAVFRLAIAASGVQTNSSSTAASSSMTTTLTARWPVILLSMAVSGRGRNELTADARRVLPCRRTGRLNQVGRTPAGDKQGSDETACHRDRG